MNNPYKPWKMVSLAGDTAYKGITGVSIFVCGEYRLSGEIDPSKDERYAARERRRWIDSAHAIAIAQGLPLLVFLETWPGNWGGSTKEDLLSKSKGMWEQLVLELYSPIGLPPPNIHEIPVSTWRAGLFGHRRWNRRQWKEAAKQRHDVSRSDNEAEANCINEFASKWSRLNEVKGLIRCD